MRILKRIKHSKKSTIVVILVLMLVTLSSFVQLGLAVDSSDLLAWYKLDGDTNDFSGNDRHMTCHGDVTSDVPGAIGSSYQFDGIDDYLDHADALWMDMETFTLCGWLNVDSFATRFPLIDHYNFGIMVYESSGRPYAYFRDLNNDMPRAESSFSINENQWHFLVATFDLAGSVKTLSLYIDGKEVSHIDSTSPISHEYGSDHSLDIGHSDHMGGLWADGLIDDIRIYPRVLFNNEVIELSLEGGLAAHYELESMAYDHLAVDSSGNIRHMECHGGVTADVPGAIGDAFQFDGIDGYLDRADASWMDMETFTLCGWLNVDSFATRFPLIDHYNFGIMVYESSGRPYAYFRDLNNDMPRAESSFSIKENQWYFLAASFDLVGSTKVMRLYIDGELIVTKTSSYSISHGYADGRSLDIGHSDHMGGLWADGLIDDVRIHPRVLNSQEITRLSLQGELAAHYKLDWIFYNPDGITVDSSENGRYMTCHGGVIANVPGAIGDAFQFDGIDDYLTMEDNDDVSFGDGSQDRPFSISIWINPGGREGNQWLAAKYRSGEREWVLRLYENEQSGYQGTYRLQLSLYDHNYGYQSVRYARSGYIIPDYTWTHVVATYDGCGGGDAQNGITLYVNGQEATTSYGKGTASYVAMENRAAPVSIGADPEYAQYYYQGKLDELRIYSGLLSLPEIAYLYYWQEAPPLKETIIKGQLLSVTKDSNDKYLPIVGASLTIRDMYTGQSSQVTTDESGNYSATFLIRYATDFHITSPAFPDINYIEDMVPGQMKQKDLCSRGLYTSGNLYYHWPTSEIGEFPISWEYDAWDGRTTNLVPWITAYQTRIDLANVTEGTVIVPYFKISSQFAINHSWASELQYVNHHQTYDEYIYYYTQITHIDTIYELFRDPGCTDKVTDECFDVEKEDYPLETNALTRHEAKDDSIVEMFELLSTGGGVASAIAAIAVTANLMNPYTAGAIAVGTSVTAALQFLAKIDSVDKPAVDWDISWNGNSDQAEMFIDTLRDHYDGPTYRGENGHCGAVSLYKLLKVDLNQADYGSYYLRVSHQVYFSHCKHVLEIYSPSGSTSSVYTVEVENILPEPLTFIEVIPFVYSST